MRSLSIEYGTTLLHAALDWGEDLGAIDVADAPAMPDIAIVARDAFDRPIGFSGSFFDGIAPHHMVTILVSDAYRKTAIDRILPTLVANLRSRGVDDTQIRFLFASGIHRAPSSDQQRAILGDEIASRHHFGVHTHDPYANDHVFLGTTSRGTPVEINRLAVESDHVIVTGTVVLHYFGGFGGGRKAIVPGIASARTIAHNHAMNLHPSENRLNPDVRIGVMTGNPVAEDMLEAARMLPVCGIVNTVLNRRGEIAGLYVGALQEAHEAACAHARSLYAVPIARQADIVIASAGAARNYVQSHKALYNAFQAMKPGGSIIFLAPCSEGLGGEPIEKWLRLGSVDAIISALRSQSEIYGQTALSTLEKAVHAIMVTELTESEVALLGARKAATIAGALRIACSERGDDASYIVMPSASYTVPFPVA